MMPFLQDWDFFGGNDLKNKSILFVCHGNICRSPMAEFIMKDLVQKAGLTDQFFIESRATTSDEIRGNHGNPIYPPAANVMRAHGLNPIGKFAQLLTLDDYQNFDLLIGMDKENLADMLRLTAGDPAGKISLIMDYTPNPRPVADPWYTRDFNQTWQDINEGCEALLKALTA